jgi:hypothetical protein
MEPITYEPVAYFISEFCTKFVISKSSFYREIRAGRLTMYKRGKRSMIERVEAERWYAAINPPTQKTNSPHNELSASLPN